MTAPLVTRDALAGAIIRHCANVTNLPEWAQIPAFGQDMRPLAEGLADALLASGVLRDPATLADDDALMDRVRGEFIEQPYSEHHAVPWVRALAAALSEGDG